MPALFLKTIAAPLTAALAAALLPAAGLADTVTLTSQLNFYTPEEDDIEYEDRINFNDGETGSTASLSETESPGDTVEQEFIIEGGGDGSPGGVQQAVIDQIIAAPWVATGSAEASYDRLAVDSYWAGGREPGPSNSAFSYGGRIEAEATAWDVLEIAGDGELTFTYSLSGSLFGSANGLDQWTDLWDIADFEIDFIAEFDKEGSSQDAEVKFSREIPSDHSGSVYNESFQDVSLDLTIGVLSGDVIDYKAWARSFQEFDDEVGVTSTRGRTDFGSTAELVSVFASDGVSFTSASGFDYMSVNASDPDPLPPVPLPAGLWLMLGGLGLLVGQRRRR